jgi:DNA repair exonuclease SbcCD nuclease subunit
MIGIIGDCHLGASTKAGPKDPVSGVSSRLMDYYTTLIWAIDALVPTCTTLVFTGDIFEHRYPQMVQQQLFSAALRHAISRGAEKIIILEGNHDQQRTSDTSTLAYLAELQLPNILVARTPQTVDIDGHKLHLFPYRDRRYYGVATYAEAIVAADSQIQDLAANNGAQTNLLVGHMALEGTFFPEEEAELYTDNELMLPKSSFSKFHLTLMGHVHTPGQISANPPIFYVGSLEKRGAFEAHKKQVVIIDPDQKSMSWVDLPCRNFFEYNLVVPKSGVEFQAFVDKGLADQIGQDEIKDAIIKINIRIKADDIGRYDVDSIRAFLQKRGVFFCLPPIMSVESERVSRSEIKEQTSDTDTWSQYIANSVDNADLASRLIEMGNSIIAEEGH